MTNWQDKYKDLEVGQSAWYWHKDENTFWKWKIVKVNCYISKQDGCKEICIDSKSHYPYSVTETFPNGPKCLTPDDITTMNKTQVFAEDIFKNLNEDKPFTFVYDGRFYSIREDELKFKQLETIPPWANQDSVERGCPFDEPNCFNPKND